MAPAVFLVVFGLPLWPGKIIVTKQKAVLFCQSICNQGCNFAGIPAGTHRGYPYPRVPAGTHGTHGYPWIMGQNHDIWIRTYFSASICQNLLVMVFWVVNGCYRHLNSSSRGDYEFWLWVPMGTRGYPWVPMGIFQVSMGTRGYPRTHEIATLVWAMATGQSSFDAHFKSGSNAGI